MSKYDIIHHVGEIAEYMKDTRQLRLVSRQWMLKLDEKDANTINYLHKKYPRFDTINGIMGEIMRTDDIVSIRKILSMTHKVKISWNRLGFLIKSEKMYSLVEDNISPLYRGIHMDRLGIIPDKIHNDEYYESMLYNPLGLLDRFSNGDAYAIRRANKLLLSNPDLHTDLILKVYMNYDIVYTGNPISLYFSRDEFKEVTDLLIIMNISDDGIIKRFTIEHTMYNIFSDNPEGAIGSLLREVNKGEKLDIAWIEYLDQIFDPSNDMKYQKIKKRDILTIALRQGWIEIFDGRMDKSTKKQLLDMFQRESYISPYPSLKSRKIPDVSIAVLLSSK